MDTFIIIEVIAVITAIFSGTIFSILNSKKPSKKDDLNERLKSIEDRLYDLQLQVDQIIHQESRKGDK